ncbi:MAG: diaminopimelate epimerase [Ignavibacteriae bacterium]|nr:diaminopimelate epimerase [Ignavibacteriota bacterium]
MKIKVTYMSGAGNLFTVIDNSLYNISHNQLVELSPLLCKSEDYKSEGLLVINEDKIYPFNADFYNPDGSYGAMCGNGARCVIKFFKEKKVTEPYPNIIKFIMCGEEYDAVYEGETIAIYFLPPEKFQHNIKIDYYESEVEGSYVDIGSQHFVVNIKNQENWKNIKIEDFELHKIAPYFRYNEQFAPKGVNFNIYEVKNKSKIILRTYERGVEGETGACGTGAISAALTSVINNETKFPVTVIPPSKIPVIVDIIGKVNKIIRIQLQGPAEFIGETEIEI